MSSLADARIADDELLSWRMRFVGRDTERARLVSLLADRSERIVTLTGPGGERVVLTPLAGQGVLRVDIGGEAAG